MGVEGITCPIYKECDVDEKSKEVCHGNYHICEDYSIRQEDTQEPSGLEKDIR